MMTTDALFAHYHKSSARMPRDPKFLEGMFVIRRLPGVKHMACGEILKSNPTKQQFLAREFSADGAQTWVAFAALLDDVILFHSRGEMSACYSLLARTWQEEYKAEHEAAKAARQGAV